MLFNVVFQGILTHHIHRKLIQIIGINDLNTSTLFSLVKCLYMMHRLSSCIMHIVNIFGSVSYIMHYGTTLLCSINSAKSGLSRCAHFLQRLQLLEEGGFCSQEGALRLVRMCCEEFETGPIYIYFSKKQPFIYWRAQT